MSIIVMFCYWFIVSTGLCLSFLHLQQVTYYPDLHCHFFCRASCSFFHISHYTALCTVLESLCHIVLVVIFLQVPKGLLEELVYSCYSVEARVILQLATPRKTVTKTT